MELSTLVLTYNHERFIARAIESALVQETSFECEIVVGDDCSTDNTRSLVLEYQDRYPDRIRLLPSRGNVGANRNFARTLQECRGSHVAVLDGDDYWTSPHKLQKQVDFLARRPDCVLCFHDVQNVFEDGGAAPPVYVPRNDGSTYGVTDLLRENFIPTSSVVFRNWLVCELPKWYYDLPFGDWTFFIFLAGHGNIGYLHEVMGAYRRRAEAAGAKTGSRQEVFWKGELEAYRLLDEYFEGRYRSVINEAVLRVYYSLAANAEQKGDLIAARAYALRRFAARPLHRQQEQPLKHLMRLYVPGLYHFAKSCKRAF